MSTVFYGKLSYKLTRFKNRSLQQCDKMARLFFNTYLALKEILKIWQIRSHCIPGKIGMQLA